MIPEKMREILKYEGAAAIVTKGEENPHVINTWNSYIKITKEECLLIPAGRMNTTEKNLKKDNKILMTIGSRQVDGLHSKGAGFLIEAIGEFLFDGEDYNNMKESFPWMRALLKIKPNKITQTL